PPRRQRGTGCRDVDDDLNARDLSERGTEFEGAHENLRTGVRSAGENLVQRAGVTKTGAPAKVDALRRGRNGGTHSEEQAAQQSNLLHCPASEPLHREGGWGITDADPENSDASGPDR